MNKEKIIIMTKLAIYDKHTGESDRKTSEYFRHDYIYRKNMWLRISALIGALILIGFSFVNNMIINKVDVFSLDYKAEIYKILFVIFWVFVIYSILGTIKYGKEYLDAENRTKKYVWLLGKLEKINSENSKEA